MTVGLRGIDAALDLLAARQLDNGELPTMFAPCADLAGTRQLDSCVFGAAVAGCALRLLPEVPLARAVLRRIRGFLMLEMGDRCLWRYWTARSGKPIDPDLDDTALASFVLADEHPELTRASHAAMLANRDERGRFRTWVRPAGAPNDVDSVVNANVALSLGRGDGSAAACAELNGLVRGRAARGSYRYYLDDLALFHAIARAHAYGVETLAPAIDAVRSGVLERQLDDGSFGDELRTALAVCALAYCAADAREHVAVERGAAALLRAQRPDGGWPARAFYAGPEPPAPPSVWFGSEELTTALCVEALALRAGAQPARPRQMV